MLLLAGPQLQAQLPTVRAFRPDEIRGLRVWDYHALGILKGARPGYVRYGWAVNFKNETNREIGSVSIQMCTGSMTVSPVGEPLVVTRFSNQTIPHEGSILPYNKTQLARYTFDIPTSALQGASRVTVKLVGATGFRHPDLHDAGHLYTALYNHSEADDLAMFKKDPTLLKVRNSQGLTATLLAFGSASRAVIQYVLAHGGSAKDHSLQGSSIMHLTIANHNRDVCVLAAEHGAHIDDTTKSGRTPLMKAVAGGNYVVWRWLLAHQANPNRQDNDGKSVADYAIMEGQTEALADLVKAGAAKNVRDHKGLGWMHYASQNYLMFDAVSRYGIAVDDRSPQSGITPLMLAAQNGIPEGVIWLIQHGANPKLRDKAGHSCDEYAARGGVNLPYIVSAYGRR